MGALGGTLSPWATLRLQIVFLLFIVWPAAYTNGFLPLSLTAWLFPTGLPFTSLLGP
jgi:hypothetical protein